MLVQKIWQWVHVCEGANIGSGVSLGQNVYIGNNVNKCKIQNNVSVYENVHLEEKFFRNLELLNTLLPFDQGLVHSCLS